MSNPANFINPFDTAAEVRRLAALVHSGPVPDPIGDAVSLVLLRYADLIERVEQLPSPLTRTTDLDGDNPMWRCQWCQTAWPYSMRPHPQNGCLALMVRPAAPTDAT